MLYQFFKIIFELTLKIFFKKIKINQAQHISSKGPIIVVANHPNTFMDPLLIGTLFKQPLFFLAKSTVFNSPVAKWLFKKLNMIPVYRKKDVADNSLKNEETFEKCYEALAQKITLLIFPEGISVHERKLQQIKTGTARIALGAEAQNDFQLGITILPIGLNYSDPKRFRSEVFIAVAAPIQVSDFQSLYQTDPNKAVLALTDKVKTALEAQVIITQNVEEDNFVKHVEMLYKNKLFKDFNLSTKEVDQDFIVTKEIIKAVHFIQEKDPEKIIHLKKETKAYFQALTKLGLTDQALENNHPNLLKHLFQSLSILLLGFPIYLYGLIFNYIPYILPSQIAKILTKEDEFVAPIMMTSGIFTFCFFYFWEIFLFYHYIPISLGLLVLYGMSLPLTGFFVLAYHDYFTKRENEIKLTLLFFRKKILITKLIQQRMHIITAMQEIQNIYLNK